MRFRSLRLHAFGPFTGHTLDLSGGAPGGLHLIFGPNEAGKSTALRAVHDLLFGIPERTQDAHLHATSELRVGAVLEGLDGAHLELQRLKKRKDSLRGKNDAPLDEGALTALLGGVDAGLFVRLFGLDHERLRQAGEDLLTGKGDVGESLFDAAGGGRGLRRVLGDLDRRAEELFKPRSQKAKLNVLLESYAEARRQARDATRPADKYLEQLAAVERAERERERLRAERRSLREEEHRLKRIFANLPRIAERARAHAELSALGEIRAIPADCRERRTAAEQRLLAARRELERCRREIERRRGHRDSLEVSEGLLALSPEIVQELRDGVGQIRKALRDRPRLVAAVRAAEHDALVILRRLGQDRSLDEAERFRPSNAALARIRRLGEQRAVLLERRASAQRTLAELEHELGRVRQKLAALPESRDLSRLEAAVRRARAAGDVEQRLSEREPALEALEARAEQRLQALGLWRGELAALARLAVPSAESVTAFEAEFRALAEHRRALADELARLVERAADCERKLQALQASGDVPSEADLERARARRQQGLVQLVAVWGRGGRADAVEPELDPALPVVEAFERTIADADEIADRLRREATRVSELAGLRAELEQTRKARERLAAELEATERRRTGVEERWRGLFTPLGIEPRGPSEMRAWLAKRQELLELWETLDRDGRAVERLKQERAALCELLADALALGTSSDRDGVVELVLAGEQALAAAANQARAQAELGASLETLEAKLWHAQSDHDEQEKALEHWSREWGQAVVQLGLPAETTPDEAAIVVGDLGEFFKKLDEMQRERKRVQGIERDAAAFAEQVRGMVELHAPELAGAPPDVAAETLAQRHDKAVHQHEEQSRLDRELDELRRELEAIGSEELSARRDLDELLGAAGARSVDELSELETRAARGRQLRAEIERVDAELCDAGEGLSLEAVLDEARDFERGALAARLEELKELHERSDEELAAAEREVTSLSAGLVHYTERQAADAAQELEVLGAEIKSHAVEYARVRLACAALRGEIERFRERNQGPVLKRARALFERLTLSRYTALRVGLEESVLVCVRADGKEVGVGELSEGTHYQLYLALRLASLERYLERNPPLPLVLDDVLIHFDDERAAAAFRVLSELAERVQILFFTHHARLLEIGKSAVPKGRLFEHLLPQRSVEPGVAQQSLF